MTSTPPAPACPTTVVVDGRSAPAGAVGRCTERVLAAVAPGTSVVVVTPRSVRLAPALARRVHAVRGGVDDHLARVAREVSQDRAVLVLPSTCTPTDAAWFEAAHARMQEQPQLIGVLGPEGGRLLAFPRGVTDVDGPRTAWSPLPGLDVRETPADGATAGRHRTVSAVLIVKDEEDVLEACLRAVAPFVDEIVVYDTGSTDRTLEIARELAGTVVEGYWDDDFGAARNRALAHATGDWVLSIDADEVAEGDPATLRRILDASTADAIVVGQINGSWTSSTTGSEIRMTRLFRRAGAQWQGALHEQINFDGGDRAARISWDPPPLRLLHSGYSATTMAEKDKRVRNVEIAHVVYEAAAPGTAERAEGAADYGRSLFGAGRVDEALGIMNTLLVQPASPGSSVLAARVAVPELLRRRQWQLVQSWLARAEGWGESSGQLVVWRAAALIGDDRLDEAAALLDDLLTTGSGSIDLWRRGFDADLAATMRAELDLLQGAPERAAARMRDVLQRSPETVNLQVLVNALGGIGLTMRDLIEEAPEAFLERALRDMVLLAPRVSLHWFAAHSAARPGDFRPVVAGNTVAARVGWVEALEWSMRAREAGITGVCALRELGTREDTIVVERVLAWTILAHQCDERDALDELRTLGRGMSSLERAAAVSAVREVLPEVDTSALLGPVPAVAVASDSPA